MAEPNLTQCGQVRQTASMLGVPVRTTRTCPHDASSPRKVGYGRQRERYAKLCETRGLGVPLRTGAPCRFYTQPHHPWVAPARIELHWQVFTPILPLGITCHSLARLGKHCHLLSSSRRCRSTEKNERAAPLLGVGRILTDAASRACVHDGQIGWKAPHQSAGTVPCWYSCAARILCRVLVEFR